MNYAASENKKTISLPKWLHSQKTKPIPKTTVQSYSCIIKKDLQKSRRESRVSLTISKLKEHLKSHLSPDDRILTMKILRELSIEQVENISNEPTTVGEYYEKYLKNKNVHH